MNLQTELETAQCQYCAFADQISKYQCRRCTRNPYANRMPKKDRLVKT